MKGQKESMRKAQPLRSTFPVRWHGKLRLGSQGLHQPPTAEAPPWGLCPGEEGAGGVGWECREVLPAAGLYGTGSQGTRLCRSQARFAKAGDRRSLKCFPLVQA